MMQLHNLVESLPVVIQPVVSALKVVVLNNFGVNYLPLLQIVMLVLSLRYILTQYLRGFGGFLRNWLIELWLLQIVDMLDHVLFKHADFHQGLSVFLRGNGV